MRAARRVWILLLGLLIGGGFYLQLIDTTSLPELYVLAAVALACAVAFEVSREQGFAEARILPVWVLAVWRVIVKIPGDIARLSLQAVAQLLAPRARRGSFRAVAFDACENTPRDAGRRALTEWMGSAAPNTIVVGVDAERGLLLVHQLHKQGGPERIDPLRLG